MPSVSSVIASVSSVIALVIAAIASVTLLSASVRAQAREWPQWRGPGGAAVADDARVPLEWGPASNVAWKTEIAGRGHSSPVVAGGRVFLTTSIRGEPVPGRRAPVHPGFDGRPGYVHPDSTDVDFKYALKVLAVDAASGKVLWERTAYDGVMFDDRHRKNTYASSTIATDGRLLYAFFESAGLYCYDVDGALKWKASLGPIIKAGMGPGTSPIIFERLLIVQCDQEMGEGSALVAVDRFTGKEVWRAARTNRRSWATPVVVATPQRRELVASGAESVIAYDPATGRELWRARGVESHPIPSPVAGHGMVFVTAGSQAKRAYAIRVGGAGDVTGTPFVAWTYAKGTAYVPSPILHGGYLYLMTDKGLLTCLDAKTGAVHYEGGRVPVPATFTASPIAIGDRLLLTSEDGDTFVVKAGRTHEVVATNAIGEPVYASLAVARGTIFIRGDRHLFAVRQ